MIQLRKFLAIAILATAVFGLIEAQGNNTLKNFEGLDEKLRKPFDNAIKELKPVILKEIQTYQKKIGQNFDSRRKNLNQFIMDELANEVNKFYEDLRNQTLNATEIEDAAKLAERVDEFAANVQKTMIPKVLAKIDGTRDNAVQNDLPVVSNELTAISNRIRSLVVDSLNKNLGKFANIKPKGKT